MGNKALKILVFIGCFSFQGIAQSLPIQLMVVDSDGFEIINLVKLINEDAPRLFLDKR